MEKTRHIKFQRHIDMLQYITNNGSATIDELVRTFNVSKATINRDINALVKTGNIVKVHGGVISNVNSDEFEMLITDKEHLYVEEKINIAKIACDMVEDDDNIIIDSGSTMLYFAKELVKRQDIKNVTVITNDIKVAYTLCSNSEITLIMVGGTKHKDGYDLYGDSISDVIISMNISKYFIGSSAWDIKVGITHTNYSDVLLKKEFMACAKESILLSDSSKDALEKKFKICSIDKLSKIITDNHLLTERIDEYKKIGVEIVIAC